MHKERKNEFMRELTFEENKQYQLGILMDVARFCDENGLRYYLAYGTLIGAIRHKGFIPWDDDIDLQMPRDDYNKFIATYKSDVYKVIDPFDDMARHSMAKVIDTRTIKIENAVKYDKGKEMGIDIDIFPLDGQPEEYDEFKKYYNSKQRLLKKFYYIISDIKRYTIKSKFAYCIPYILSNLTTKNTILDKVQKINEKYDFESSKYVGATDSLYNSINNRNPKEWYNDAVLLEFEGCNFKAPVGFHEILEKMYGDYMMLPPKEKQVTHHSNKVYLKD